MKSIDFLPDIYRQREALRRARLWWGIVVVVFGGAIGASTLAQAWLRHSIHQQMDSLSADFAAAQTQVQELSTLQSQIVRAGHEASLYTFLENPWPRTQLLAQIVGPMPDCIRITQIHISEQESAKTAIQAGPRNVKADEDAAAKATGPEKDLARLQEEMDRRQTMIEIDGHSSDVSKLHDYVAAVSRSPLVADATIKSLEAAPNQTAQNQAGQNQAGKTRFTLRLQIRPGYCQQRNDVAGIKPSAATASTTAAAAGQTAGGGE